MAGRCPSAARWAALIAVVLAAGGCGSPTKPAAAPTTTTTTTAAATTTTGPTTTPPATTGLVPTAASPCGVRRPPAHFAHVIWIWMENHSYGAVIGSGAAPYLNGLAHRCGLALNYHNISHPSLPNYMAATSGLPLSDLGPFASDCSPSPGCRTAAPSIFGQGETWKAYEESMPANCAGGNAGDYAARHNPPPYYTTLAACSSFDVPFPRLATDLAAGTLPAFSFVTPNVVDDMHDGTVSDGDQWLARNVDAILGSASYRAGGTAVFITWDEGEGGSSSDCATNTTDVGCHVATVVVSPSTPAGATSGVLFNHYALLATAEQLLGLPPLGQAATAATMTAAFGL